MLLSITDSLLESAARTPDEPEGVVMFNLVWLVVAVILATHVTSPAPQLDKCRFYIFLRNDNRYVAGAPWSAECSFWPSCNAEAHSAP